MMFLGDYIGNGVLNDWSLYNKSSGLVRVNVKNFKL